MTPEQAWHIDIADGGAGGITQFITRKSTFLKNRCVRGAKFIRMPADVSD
jgi:hypothetical protein